MASGSEMKYGRFKYMKVSLPGSSAPASDTAQARAATSPRFRRPSVSRLGFGWVVSAGREAGFTLTEVVVAMAMIALTFAGVIYGYIRTADRTEWSSYSLAAQSLAMQGVEQVRAAKWDTQAWPVVDDLGVTNYMQVEELDVPVAGQPVLATNYIRVTTVSVNPPLRELRADCVWALKSRPAGIAGPFTNTAVTLRAADQ
jgi:prepilin-type N-terminal cleavage/methylation domain-containing protein